MGLEILIWEYWIGWVRSSGSLRLKTGIRMCFSMNRRGWKVRIRWTFCAEITIVYLLGSVLSFVGCRGWVRFFFGCFFKMYSYTFFLFFGGFFECWVFR